jgi:tRNA (guanine37-N1)-methyltransferase
LRLDILSIFPELFTGPFSAGMVRQALDRDLVQLHIWDLRDFTDDVHRSTDDYPYGGGHGMVLKPEPVFRAVEHVRTPESRVVFLTPQGRQFDQEAAQDLAGENQLVFICGRYEGIDQRIREALVTDELSVGDYVLSGGELPAMVVVDSVVRLLPGLLDEEVPVQDSFGSGLLEGPHYTRPREYRGMKVPAVLLSGHHDRIRRWRRKQALRTTLERRPELLSDCTLSAEDKQLLIEIESEHDSP